MDDYCDWAVVHLIYTSTHIIFNVQSNESCRQNDDDDDDDDDNDNT